MIGDGTNDCMDCELSLLQSSSDTLSATGHRPRTSAASAKGCCLGLQLDCLAVVGGVAQR